MEAKHGAAREIALALGVPPMLLGIPGDNTFANYQEANRTFWRQTVLPLVQRTAAALSEWLGDGAFVFKPDLDNLDALSSERDAQWTRLEKTSFLTDDEKRAAIGYGPKNQSDQKFNPHHSPHNGQFTTAEGAGGNDIIPVAGRAPPPKQPAPPTPPPKLATPAPTPIPPGATIRNKDLAGKKHPDTGIPFDKEGFPDFSGVTQKEVKFPQAGNYTTDFAKANQLAGYSETPKDMTWHHHQDGNRMQLVPLQIHRQTGHTGSIGIGNLPGKR